MPGNQERQKRLPPTESAATLTFYSFRASAPLNSSESLSPSSNREWTSVVLAGLGTQYQYYNVFMGFEYFDVHFGYFAGGFG